MPADLLAGIVATGSGGHPWTSNVEGQGAYHATKAEALAHIRSERARGKRSVDIGCSQINLRWHPDTFSSPEAGFDPETNIRYAAEFLSRLRDRNPTWRAAVGAYHSPSNADRARRYAQRVYDNMDTVDLPETRSEAPVVISTKSRPVVRPSTSHKIDGITRTSQLPGVIGSIKR